LAQYFQRDLTGLSFRAQRLIEQARAHAEHTFSLIAKEPEPTRNPEQNDWPDIGGHPAVFS
jgi:hypothetical protein